MLTTNSTTNATLPKFEVIKLASCNLKEFPDFLRFQDELEVLNLANNGIHGQVPTWLWNTSKETTRDINLHGNFLTGFEQHPNATFLDVVGSNFWGQVPSSIANLSKLTILGLGDFTFDAQPLRKLSKLIILNLANTKLSDVLPESLANMTQLSMLLLHNNELFGEIPSWLLNLTRLTFLDLSENKLSGMFPSSISQLKHLEYLDFSFNRLQGPLPLPPPSVLYYRVASNLLTGKVPTSFCQNRTLFALDLSDNNLSGAIPQCLASFSSGSLLLFNLSNNFFHDIFHLFEFVVGLCCNFPDPMVNLIARFHGAIENPKTNSKFPKLRIIDLSHNGFFGTFTLLSEFFQNWNAMKMVGKGNSTYMQVETPVTTGVANIVYSMDFTYSITISSKGTKRLYEKIQSVFVAVDLSDNKFSGEIPENLGRLCGLQALNISENKLTGLNSLASSHHPWQI
ncbi:hypothetical protein RHMOL_Rhmol04G0060400 [Rhododendron molle]|uniref:Uncharacterized protein n=1 Tax=Rhododendron molle TaxID=49168 RepID=A0ACC0NXW6_RHOML|nr:hypothetical protein RHMOL_Rhmol04G0060400 [Rhododendron molle]